MRLCRMMPGRLLTILTLIFASAQCAGASVSVTVSPDTVVTDTVVADTAAVVHGAYLKFEPGIISLGKFYPSDRQEAEITFTNTGDEPLSVVRIMPDCGCTTVKFDYSQPVEPGTRATITVKFDGRKRMPGRFRKVVRVRSNARNPLCAFFVEGEILAPRSR